MNYVSPIDIITTQTRMAYEKGVLKAVFDAGFIVEKEELIKALAYDRGQYNKGFNDAKQKMLNILEEMEMSPEYTKSCVGDYIGCVLTNTGRIREKISEL